MCRLTDIPLLSSLLDPLSLNLTSLHVRTVAQLSLLVLKVGIVCGIWPAREVVVAAHDVVVWRGGSCDA